MFENIKRSLGLKAILLLCSILIVILTIITIMNIVNQNKILLQKGEDAAKRLTESILTAMRYPMLTGDQEIIQLQFEAFGKLKDIDRISLTDHNGIIRRSSDKGLLGQKSKLVHLEDSLNGKKIHIIELSEYTGKEVFKEITPILNEKKCYGCHGSDENVLGVLKVHLDWESVLEAVNKTKNRNVLLSLLGLVIISVLSIIFLLKVIIFPIKKLEIGMKKVSQGDLNQRIVTENKDEIGELTNLFNKMTEELYKTMVSRDKLAGEVAERKKAEEKIRLSVLYTRSLIEASLDPLVTISPDGKITDVNKATEQVIGVPRENLIGSDFSDYFTEPEKAREGYKQVFLKGFVKDYPLAIQHKSGSVTDVLYNANIYKNEAGGIQGVFAAARDITERKKAEEELKKAYDNLKELQERLIRSEKLAVLGKLGGIVSHELRNPLGVIKNAVYFLRMRLGKTIEDEKIKRYLDILDEEVINADRIITNILTFTKIKESRLTETEINDVIKISLKKVEIPQTIEVVTELKSDLPKILADAVQLERLFYNIILNAVEAMPKGGRLTVTNIKKDDFLEVHISDTGKGISKENLDKIFGPLFSTKPHGIGLGLSFCQDIIQGHKGRIEVESEVDKGTTVIVRLPIDQGI